MERVKVQEIVEEQADGEEELSKVEGHALWPGEDWPEVL